MTDLHKLLEECKQFLDESAHWCDAAAGDSTYMRQLSARIDAALDEPQEQNVGYVSVPRDLLHRVACMDTDALAELQALLAASGEGK